MRKLIIRRIAAVFLGAGAFTSDGTLLAQVQPDVRAATDAPGAWSIMTTVALTSFRGAASATSAAAGSDDVTDVAIRPSQGVAIGVAATRRWRAWSASLGFSYLPTRVEAVSSDVAVQDRTEALGRVRLAATIARQLVRVGTGSLEVRAGPALDTWSAYADDGRAVVSGEASLALLLPAGPVTLENVLGFGWSPGPFRAAELPEGYEREALRAISVGMGIRFGL